MGRKSAMFFACFFLFCPSLWAQENITHSIVKIYTTYNQPSYSRPWQMLGQDTRTGSGCIIDGSRILTNAHVVSDHTFIRVRRAGKADKYVAFLEAISHELDLAVLKVKDKAFFRGARPLEVGRLLRVGDRVTAYGFPRGGTRITITKGVVSRIDRRQYAHTRFSNLVCQIDAAINPGSSGGPVISQGKIAGVSFQSTSGQNIGYMVPAPVILHFFQDLEDGKHDGVPGLPIVWQNLENPQIRSYYGMAQDHSGILVTEVSPRFLDEKMLTPGDIMIAIDGFDVANDGTILFREGERISLGYAIDRKQVGQRIGMTVLRKGRVLSLLIPLHSPKVTYGYLIPRVRYETLPTYYTIGGLVFSPLTTNYLKIWKKWSKVPPRLKGYYYEITTKENQQRKDVVVLIDVLPDEVNVGYIDFEDSVVSKVNGKTINGMQDLVEAFEGEGKGDHHRIILEPYGREILLSRELSRKRGPMILKKYKVTADRSMDLREP
ncbi:MAG: serine protease [Deltaproteobacteria bacterium]|nr:serine protease [Deltaproteobacteria bacterium]